MIEAEQARRFWLKHSEPGGILQKHRPTTSWRLGLVNTWSKRAATGGIRGTVTVQTRLVVLGDRIGRISKYSDQSERSSQVQ